MKWIYVLLSSLFIVFLLEGAYLFSLVFVIKENHLILREESRPVLKEMAQLVYDKAAEYNPEGDLFPDHIDDSIKEKFPENLE